MYYPHFNFLLNLATTDPSRNYMQMNPMRDQPPNARHYPRMPMRRHNDNYGDE